MLGFACTFHLMADFCRDCSIRVHGRDAGDLKPFLWRFRRRSTRWIALCEGCGGEILVDRHGQRDRSRALSSEPGDEDISADISQD